MKHTPLTGFGLLRAARLPLPLLIVILLSILIFSATIARSAISFADIRLWAGAAAGPDINEAAVVIDFRDGSPGLVWGYRWPAQEPRTGQDMLAAILGADPALGADSTFFPNSITYGARSRSFSDNGTPKNYFDDSYWGYWVNNDVYYHPTDFLLNSHIVPPATEVVPLGNPFEAGHWVESSTGSAARPLVNGSWDGWAYGVFGTRPNEPVPAVPEPGSAALAALFFLLRRRRGLRAARCRSGSRSLLRRGAQLGELAGFPSEPSQQAATDHSGSRLPQSTGLAALTVFLVTVSAHAAGPYPPGPGQPGSDAIPAASAMFKSWAQSVGSIQPGPRLAGASSSPADYGSAASVTGPPDAAGVIYPEANGAPVPSAPVLSLGDGGTVTLRFSPPIADGAGPDFAVFENGFTTSTTNLFAELAFVEVSSNGADFTRFPAVSCTQTATQISNALTLDPRNLHNLAGKYPAGYGTPFDLAELAGASPALDAGSITHVRIVDVLGDVKSGHGSRDANGNWINDPFPTNFQTGGFDLDAVGVIHQAPDSWQGWIAASFDPAVQNDPAVTAADADPDGDGKPNLLEYACGSSPAALDTAAVDVSISPDKVAIGFYRAARADTALTLQQSGDGLTWTTLAASAGGHPAVPAAGAQVIEGESSPVLVTVTAPRTAARQFYRLAVQRTP
jgi:hypothetical protein